MAKLPPMLGAGNAAMLIHFGFTTVKLGRAGCEFAPRRGKVTESSHIGTYSEKHNPRFYLGFLALREGSNPFCSTTLQFRTMKSRP